MTYKTPLTGKLSGKIVWSPENGWHDGPSTRDEQEQVTAQAVAAVDTLIDGIRDRMAAPIDGEHLYPHQYHIGELAGELAARGVRVVSELDDETFLELAAGWIVEPD